jgi:hypothetical protein
MGFSIEPSTEIAHRHDFSLLANARGYKDAVEVGVDQAVFAREFLSRFEGNWVVLIDPYEPYPEMDYDRTIDAMVAVHAVMPWHGRFRFIRERSPKIVPFITTILHPDFVYIDGAHDESSVMEDLMAWWDVLPPNGMLAGHDFDGVHPGVTRAVKAFAEERGLAVRLTHETEHPPSWYVYRHEPATLIHVLERCESPNPHAAKGR